MGTLKINLPALFVIYDERVKLFRRPLRLFFLEIYMRTNRLVFFAVMACAMLFFAAAASAQKRDNLTAAEVEIVRDAQEIDKRVSVMVKAVDRRLAVLSGSTADPAKMGKLPKNAPDWGDLPTGTHAQLFWDIEHILDESINDIDDIATREPDNKLMMKADKMLGEACARILPELRSYAEKSTDDKEKMSLENAIEYAQSVVDSLKKVPTDIDEQIKQEGKDKKKDKDDDDSGNKDKKPKKP
jgi:hypothetical protein